MQAFTIEAKLSSTRIISAANYATSVPAIPIANPTSAFLIAGASFVPSPVTATTSPHYLSPVTNKYLSSGRDLANTLKFCLMILKSSMFLMHSLISFFEHLHYLFDILESQFLHHNPPIFLKNAGPSITTISLSKSSIVPSFESIIKHSYAIATAVILLSPVTILTTMLASLH